MNCQVQDQDVCRFSGKVPNVSARGEIESMCMYAGTGVGQIKEILPAATVIRRLVEGARDIIEQELRSKVTRQDIMGLKTMV